MSIGEHTVRAYPVGSSGGWGVAPSNPNPNFDTDLAGWSSTTLAWVAPGKAYAPIAPNQGAAIDTAKPLTMTRAAPDRYRLRVDFQTTGAPESCNVLLYFYQDAAGTDPSIIRAQRHIPITAGTRTITVDIDANDVDPAYAYLMLQFTVVFKSGGGAVWVDSFGLTRAIAGTDLSCLVDEVAIQHGRDDTTAQPEASAATITLDLTDDVLPADVDIGSELVVTTTVAGTTSTRFHGRVSDLALGFDDAGEDTPSAGQGQLNAVGFLADLGRRVVGDAPFPQELDGARVQRILTLAGFAPSAVTSDPGTVQVLPRDIDARAALEVAQDTAVSASGLVWQTRDSDVRYADSSHRRGIVTALTLDACDVLVTPTWSRSLQGLINKVTVAYGVAPEGGEQPTTSGTNPTSVTRYGTYDYSLTSELAALADAQSMVGLLLARNALPVWVMTALPVAVKDLSDDETTALLTLDMHDLVTVTGMPAISAGVPTTASLWVEGWSERLAWGVHDLELHVSGYCRTAPAPRWDDVSPDETWDTANRTWDEAACFGPPILTDRWTDVPASLRWDTTTTTWDTYTPGGM